MEGSTIIYGSTVTVKSVTLQRDSESDYVNSTTLYGRGEVCVFAARWCQNSVCVSGNSVSSAMPDGEVFHGKFSL